MRVLTSLAALLLASCSAPAPVAGSDPPRQTDGDGVPSAAASSVAEGNAAFGVALYKRLAGEPGNLFVSPISIAGAFGPVTAGAEGETQAALVRTLRLPGVGAELHAGLGGLLRNLEREAPGTTLSIASGLWVQRGFVMKPEFVRTAREDYAAAIETLDFRETGAAADRINGWVSHETRARIPTLISPDMLGPSTRLVVTNAVYFLGDWARTFEASATSEQPFHLSGGTTKTVPLMQRTGPYRYFEAGTFQAIDLPYKDGRLSMSVFLPKARDGLPAFEASLTEERLKSWLGRLDSGEPTEVQLHLPKLKIEKEYDLIPPLSDLGMSVAFTPRADLGGIADADLMISEVIHKTFLRMDEKGTEAAAATGIVVVETSARPEPPTFRADHPFFLVIRDKESGAILFLGRIASPEPV